MKLLGGVRPVIGRPHSSELDAYRIGLGATLRQARGYYKEGEWWGIRSCLKPERLIRDFKSCGFKMWQVEWPGCQRAIRGWTESHARHRAYLRLIELDREWIATRDAEKAEDIRHG